MSINSNSNTNAPKIKSPSFSPSPPKKINHLPLSLSLSISNIFLLDLSHALLPHAPLQRLPSSSSPCRLLLPPPRGLARATMWLISPLPPPPLSLPPLPHSVAHGTGWRASRSAAFYYLRPAPITARTLAAGAHRAHARTRRGAEAPSSCYLHASLYIDIYILWHLAAISRDSVCVCVRVYIYIYIQLVVKIFLFGVHRYRGSSHRTLYKDIGIKIYVLCKKKRVSSLYKPNERR